MKRKRTAFEKIIVNLWSIVVFCGVGILALELPPLLSEILGIDLDTFTINAVVIVGFVMLYFKAKDIKDREAEEETIEKIQNAIKQHNTKS